MARENNEIKVTVSIFQVMQSGNIGGQNRLAFRHNQIFSLEGINGLTTCLCLPPSHTGCFNKMFFPYTTSLAYGLP